MVIVKVWVQVDTTESVSVTVQDAVPLTGPDEAAMPVTVAVRPSGLRTTVAEGSEKEYEAAETVPPDGVTPSARSGWMDACEVWPMLRTRALFGIGVSPKN